MEKDFLSKNLSRRQLLFDGLYLAGTLALAHLIGCQKSPEDEGVEINIRFASNLEFLTNQERRARGLPTLKEDDVLTAGAQIYASYLALLNFPNSPVGASAPPLEDRLKAGGFRPESPTKVGETLITGKDTSPKDLLEGLLNDQGEILLDPKFKSMGVGCYSKGPRIWCVQYFAGEIE